MPTFFADGVERTRNEHRGKLKLHRNRRGAVGPNLISKVIWNQDSHLAEYDFVGDNGMLRKHYKQEPFAALKAADRLTLEGLSVPYSLNKKQRWSLLKDLLSSLKDLQDESINLRVSLARVALERSDPWEYPEDSVGWISFGDVVLEFHGYNGDEEVTTTKPMKLEKLVKAVRNPRKKDMHDRLRLRPAKLREDTTIPHDQKMLHVVFKELVLTTRYGKYMPKKPYHAFCLEEEREQRRVKTRGRKGRSHRLCRMLRRKLLTSDQRTVDIEIEELPSLESGKDREPPRTIPLAAFTTKARPSLHRKKRKHKDDRCPEYLEWYTKSPSSDACSQLNEEHEEEEEDAKESEAFYYSSLPEFILDSPDGLDYCAAKELLKEAERVRGVLPDTYIANLSSQQIPPFNGHCIGALNAYLILQPFLCDSVLKYRVLCNSYDGPFRWKDLNFGDTALVTASKEKTSFLSLDLNDTSISYSQDSAKNVALEQIYLEHSKKDVAKKCVPSEFYGSYVCCICYSDDQDGFALKCLHYACRQCWSQYAGHRLKSALVPIICPQSGCNGILTDEQALIFLPVAGCDRYRMLLSNKEFMKPSWIHCTHCSRMVHYTGNFKQNVVICDCGEILCIHCKESQHIPLTCDEAGVYLTAIKTNETKGVYQEQYTVRVKRCPECNNFCERSDGCSHMTCMCGAEFCYVCGKKWIFWQHQDCSIDVSENVELQDVPRGVFNNIPIKVFYECLECRKDRNWKNFHHLKCNLQRIFGRENDIAEKTAQLYALASRIVEMSTLKVALLKRAADCQGNKNGLLMALKMGHIRAKCSSLRFDLSCLKNAVNMPDVKAACVIDSSKRIRRSLAQFF